MVTSRHAIDFADEGQTDAAARELKKSAAKLKAFGSRYQDDEMLEKAEEMETRADEIRQKGMTPKSRKIMRTDSYQLKYQQKSK